MDQLRVEIYVKGRSPYCWRAKRHLDRLVRGKVCLHFAGIPDQRRKELGKAPETEQP